ncbi:diguanylate cyclase domain-containing protein [Jannaschia sp. R86511]|uniref:sensor domain-containing diguanylate cyclase n=1 Tax=Jannaschia sp. R86511 TaxID=3093853 RepID=UPI0036D23ADF
MVPSAAVEAGTGPDRSRFADGVASVLGHLRTHHPMTLWGVTRVEDGAQTHLHLPENGYGLLVGDRMPWSDTLCRHMVDGQAPRVAPDTALVPAYRDAPAARELSIQAYAGVPIREPDGTLFGVLCGLDRRPQPDLDDLAPLLELLRGLLGHLLATERELEEAGRLAVSAVAGAETDALTGLLNRRGWDRAVARAQRRLTGLGDPSVVVVADLDGFKRVNDELGHGGGDRHLVRAAAALRAAARPQDAVARLGGDEFGVLLTGFPGTGAAAQVAVLSEALAAVGVPASFGCSAVRVGGDLVTALALADSAMYAHKRGRRAAPAGAS